MGGGNAVTEYAVILSLIRGKHISPSIASFLGREGRMHWEERVVSVFLTVQRGGGVEKGKMRRGS